MKGILGVFVSALLCAPAVWAGVISVDVNDGACVSGSGQADPYAVVYCSIQDAVDEGVAGDRINIAAGTYNEQVRIDKDLTIVGGGSVIIDPNGAGYEGPYTGTDQVYAAVLFETGASGATLQNVTIQNSNASELSDNAGIEVIDGDIDNVTIEDVVVDAVSGHGFGAYHHDHTWPSCDGWLIESCEFSTSASGAWAGMRPENMDNLTIQYCDVGPTNDGGILLMQANAAEVLDCHVHDTQLAGIQIDAECTDVIDIKDNEVVNANLAAAAGYGDIRIYSTQENPHSNTPAAITVDGNILRDGLNGVVVLAGDLSTRTSVSIQNNAFVDHSNYAVLNLATGVLDAESCWWHSPDGPDDTDGGTNEVTLATCGSYTVAEMLNAVAESSGELGGAVSDNVDYCPWLGVHPRMTIEADAECYSTGDTVTIGLWMRDQTATIVSGQFFLSYDETLLDYQSSAAGDYPFTVTVYSAVNETAGTIDYAAGLQNGASGTSSDTRMAVLTFQALAPICSETDLITFRQHNPPSRLGDDLNTPIYPLLVDLDVLDDEAPTATQGAINACYDTVGDAETAALAATTDPIDNCADSGDITLTASTVGDCSAVVTVRVEDECGNYTNYDYNTRIDNVAPTAAQGTIDACYASVAAAEAAAVTATTNPTDNCSDPNDIALTASTVGDCSAVVTVRVEDECGKYTEYNYNTRVDSDAPTATQGSIDACYDSAAEAETAALVATTAHADNCTDPNDLVVTVATVGDCSAVVTVTLTDECSNSVDYDYNTRIDNVAPTAVQGTIDACYASVAAAETAALAATTGPTDNCSDPNDIVLTASTVGDCSAVVTVRVEDECGKYTEYNYNTRVDSDAPTATQGSIDACYDTAAEAETAALAATTAHADNCTDPNDLVVTVATAGDCSAVVTVTLTDECDNSVDYDYNTRIDNVAPTATQGAIDACYATVGEAETAAIAATTSPTDNCSDPNDIALTAATVGDCSAVVTVTVTDECGKFTDYIYNTRVDNTPPTATQGTVDACYATEAEAEAAAIAATTSPTDNCSDPNDITLTASTVGDCSAVVTVRVEDECGVFTNYDYNTRVDNEDPVVTPPADISVHADAGLCTATVDPGAGGATDNCTASLTVTGTRSDALDLADPYPYGVTTITWETSDECGNTGSAPQTVTVSEFNELIADVELMNVSQTTLTRCITFEFHDCDLGASETVEKEITFTNGVATGVSVLVDCGVYDCLRVRDGLHSLWRMDSDDFAVVGLLYDADLTDATGGGGDDDSLIGGNLFDDVPPYAPPQFIDIMDYTVFVNDWATDYGTGNTTCATVWPHADITSDGLVDSADFTFIQTYFLYEDESLCCGMIGGGGGPRASISVLELHERGLGHLAPADLNNDGWIDEADIGEFLNGARPHKPRPIQLTPNQSTHGDESGVSFGEHERKEQQPQP